MATTVCVCVVTAETEVIHVHVYFEAHKMATTV